MAVAQSSTTSDSGTGQEKLSMASSPNVTDVPPEAAPGTAGYTAYEAANGVPKRRKDPGLRVVGGRIYDPKHGKTCHQCRQKTMDFSAACKEMKKDKLCPIKFCRKCLINRYGEKVEEAAADIYWKCPKCRGVCNCSCCMKKKGHRPTGILVHVAKSVGYSSVHDLLHNKGEEFLNPLNALQFARNQEGTEPLVAGDYKVGALPNSCDAEVRAGPEKVRKRKAKKSYLYNDQNENGDPNVLESEDVVLPQGVPLVEVAGMEFAAEDVGAALQFLEFCSSFAKVLDLRKGQAEAILREIGRGRTRRQASYSCTIEFHLKLISIIQNDIEEESTKVKTPWLQAIGNCVAGSEFPFEEISLDWFQCQSSNYDTLDSSVKLKLVNFLCDKSLETSTMRSWIDQEHTRFKEAKRDIRDKEKAIKQKFKDELAKAMMQKREKSEVPISVSEVGDLISVIKSDAQKAHAELVTSAEADTKKEMAGALRTEPLFFDGCGRAYWKLGSFSGVSDILCQDFGSWDAPNHTDKWFFYDEENAKVIEENILLKRRRIAAVNRKKKCSIVDSFEDSFECKPLTSTTPDCLNEGTNEAESNM